MGVCMASIILVCSGGQPGRSVEHRSQVVGQRRDELHAAAVARMRERQPRGVQERPLEPLHGADVARHAPVHAAVQRVADDRVADGAQVHADLMRPAGVDRHLAERQPRQVMRAGDPGHRLARVLGARRHLLPVRRVAADRRVDAAAGLHHAPHERDVFLLDLAIVELTRQLLVRGVVLGDHHHARRAAIQPVHDARAAARRRCR